MAKRTGAEVCVINVDNEESGVQFVFSNKGDLDTTRSFDVDEGDEAGTLEITPEFDSEFSVVFPEGAWVTIEGGRLTVKFAQYGGDTESIVVYGYDLVRS